MSLATPTNIRTLQRKLYLKAKAGPDFRFYLLYDKIRRADILRHAFDRVCANKGAPGVDGVSCAMVEAAGLENWLGGIETDLRDQDVSAPAGATDDDPQARRRRWATRHSDD